MTCLVVIDTKTATMRRYEGRRRTHKAVPSDLVAHPLSAAYLPLINDFRVCPEQFFVPSDPRHEPPRGAA